MTTCNDIIKGDISRQLVDAERVIWGDAALCKYISEAQNACILLGVDANVVTENKTLSPSSMQSLPTGGIRLIDVHGARKIPKEVMDEAVPGWMDETTTSSIEHFMYDDENPRIFWVYKKPATGSITNQISYAKSVSLLKYGTDPLTLPDSYIPAIKEFVLWRAMSEEGANIGVGLANIHLQNFYTLIGKKYQGDMLMKAVQNG